MALRILVVDDEKLSRQYVRAMIAEAEPAVDILEADSQASALAILRSEKVDILFLDIMMPGTDGFGLLRGLSSRDFELVFITAHNQYAIEAIREGAADYLLKPIRKSDFRAVLKKVMARRQEKLDREAYIRQLEESRQQNEENPREDAARVLSGTPILTEEDWVSFRAQFDTLHPGFLHRLRERHPALTQAEIRLMALSKLRLTTKEMAAMLGVSPETIRQTRWRLKKKVELEDEQDLNDLAGAV